MEITFGTLSKEFSSGLLILINTKMKRVVLRRYRITETQL